MPTYRTTKTPKWPAGAVAYLLKHQPLGMSMTTMARNLTRLYGKEYGKAFTKGAAVGMSQRIHIPNRLQHQNPSKHRIWPEGQGPKVRNRSTDKPRLRPYRPYKRLHPELPPHVLAMCMPSSLLRLMAPPPMLALPAPPPMLLLSAPQIVAQPVVVTVVPPFRMVAKVLPLRPAAKPQKVPAQPDRQPANVVVLNQVRAVSARLRTCQYPFGTPGKKDFRFCGEATWVESATTWSHTPYCREHHLKCHIPYSKRSA